MSTPTQTSRDRHGGTYRLGKYELIANIGQGGMAEVFLARQVGPAGFAKLVVVKAIRSGLADQEAFVNMFLDEARIAANISHPNVVQVFDLGEEHSRYFIVMEYLAGESLASTARLGRKLNRPLDSLVTAYIVARAAEGLHAAHELRDPSGNLLNVVHRDVTPSNIIVLYDGGIKLVDFGVAKARGRLTHTVGDGLKGKLAYMSPEQVRGQEVDRRSDIFTLGIVLWETLTHRRLFKRDNEAATLQAISSETARPPSHYNPAISEELDAIALKALQPHRDKRYSSAQEVQHALDRLVPADFKNLGALPVYMRELFADRIDQRAVLLRQIAEARDTSIELDISGIEAQFRSEENGSGSGSISMPGFTPAYLPEAPTRATPRRPAARPGEAAEGSSKLPLFLGLGALVLVAGASIALWPSGTPPTQVAEPPPPIATAKAEAPATPGSGLTLPPPAAPRPPPPAPTKAAVDPPKHRSTRRRPKTSRPKTSRPKIAADPQKARTLYNLGLRAFISGKLPAAKTQFNAALKADPAHAPAHRGLGLVAEKMGNKRLAARHFRAYLKQAPRAADAASIKARLAKL